MEFSHRRTQSHSEIFVKLDNPVPSALFHKVHVRPHKFGGFRPYVSSCKLSKTLQKMQNAAVAAVDAAALAAALAALAAVLLLSERNSAVSSVIFLLGFSWKNLLHQ